MAFAIVQQDGQRLPVEGLQNEIAIGIAIQVAHAQAVHPVRGADGHGVELRQSRGGR